MLLISHLLPDKKHYIQLPLPATKNCLGGWGCSKLLCILSFVSYTLTNLQFSTNCYFKKTHLSHHLFYQICHFPLISAAFLNGLEGLGCSKLLGFLSFCKSKPAKFSIINKLWFPKKCTYSSHHLFHHQCYFLLLYPFCWMVWRDLEQKVAGNQVPKIKFDLS